MTWRNEWGEEEDPREEYDLRDPDREEPTSRPGSNRPEFWHAGGQLLTTRESLTVQVFDIGETLAQATGRNLTDEVFILARALATWVADLPASERNHHSGPFGMLDHSIDAAHRFVTWAARSPSSEPWRARWLAVGVALAFFHDVGKLRDLVVPDPAGQESWNPLLEPLTHFRERHGLPWSGRRDFQWIPCRGAQGHNVDVFELVNVILPPEFTRAFRRDLRQGLHAVACRSPKRLEHYAWPLPYLSVAVRHADRESACLGGVSR